MAAKVFFSYSHKDEPLRDRLEVALAMLKRSGDIETWHDRRLLAGEKFGPEIITQIDQADVVILLVSPDFLNSDYCYEIEKAHALERAQKSGTKVVSVILKPCDWKETDLSNYIVLPKDGKPVSKWPDVDDAFEDITESIRMLVNSLPGSQPRSARAKAAATKAEASTSASITVRSSNLRIAKQFMQEDLDRFVDEAFEVMAKLFEGSLAELQSRNPEISTRFKRIDANRFTATIYRSGKRVQACTIFLGGAFGSNGISYVQGETTASNSFNETLSPHHDSHSIFLSAGMAWHSGSERDQKLTAEGGAELFWGMLIEPLQR